MIRFAVHVHPGSRRSSVGGEHDGSLSVHVRARAVEGEATKETLIALAVAFAVRPASVQCVRGHHARTKFITIEGDDRQLRERLDLLLQGPLSSDGKV